MKNTRNLFALTLILACLSLIVDMSTVTAVNPMPSAHGSARSGDLALTFRAMQHRDGSVEGRAVFRDRAAGNAIEIEIECLSVGHGPMTSIGATDDASLIGIVNKSTSDEFPAGSRVWFIVKDTGHGKDAHPDQFTLPAPAGEGCLEGPLPGAFLESEQGNIVVAVPEAG